MKSKIVGLLFLFIICSYILNSQNWIQIGEDIYGDTENDYLGISVSINSDGKIIACGADGNDKNGKNSGAVKIFKFTDNKWEQLGQDIYGEKQGDNFGKSISLNADGTIIAASAPKNDKNGKNSGSVKIYKYDNGSWVQLGNDILGENKGTHFGNSISLCADGLTVAIGTMWDNINGYCSGSVRVFKYFENSWQQIGDGILGMHNSDCCGASVYLSSDASIVAVSSPGSSENNTNTGQVRIFKNIDNEWVQIGSGINGLRYKDYDTYLSLSSDGKTIAIGSVNSDENGINAGKVRIFKYISDDWIQIGNSILGDATGDFFGRSVSLNSKGNIIAIGAVFNDGNGINSGQVKVFKLINDKWIQIGKDLYGEYEGDSFGISVELSDSGSLIVIGGIGIEGGQICVYNYKE